MSQLTRPNSTKNKSKEFGKPHSEKIWREKRMNRKAMRDRKHKEDRTHAHARSFLKSKLRHRHALRNHVVAEKNDYENGYHPLEDIWSYDELEARDYQKRDDEREYEKWVEEVREIQYEMERAQTNIKLAHERESANAFVNLIRDVLGEDFHGQEFERPLLEETDENYHRQDMTFAEFRIVLPDTTPRTSNEVWITLREGTQPPKLQPGRNRYPRQQRRKSSSPSQCIRLFRSGSDSVGSKTLVEFLDEVLNDIVRDVFELSLPTTLIAIVSSFCSGSMSQFECLSECVLTIGGDGCEWYPGGEPECWHECDCCCNCDEYSCRCDGGHQISMAVSSRVGCEDQHSQLDAMSHDWKEMAVYAFTQEFLCSSFSSYQDERRRHVQRIMRCAEVAAVSWEQPEFGMVVFPFKPSEPPFDRFGRRIFKLI